MKIEKIKVSKANGEKICEHGTMGMRAFLEMLYKESGTTCGSEIIIDLELDLKAKDNKMAKRVKLSRIIIKENQGVLSLEVWRDIATWLD